MNERIQRLNLVMEYLGLTKNNMALSCGIGPSNLNKMLTGEQTITDKTLHKISETYPQINVDWLKNGAGDMLTPRLNVQGNGNVVQNGQAGRDLNQSGVCNSEQLFHKFIEGLKAQNSLTERSMTQTDRALEEISEQRKMMQQLIDMLDKNH